MATTVSPEAITKAAAAAALVCFLSGLLVVQAYVYSLGFSVGDVSVPKARLVYTGVLWLGSIALATLAPVAAWQLVAGAVRTPREKFGVEQVGSVLIAPMVLAIPVGLFAVVLGDFGEAVPKWSTAGSAYVLAAFAGLLLFLCWKLVRSGLTSDGQWAFLVIMLALFTVFYAGWYVHYFATEIYPHIPEQYGGGKPVRAWLMARDAETASALDEAGLPIVPGNLRSDPVDLLYDDERMLVVRRSGSGDATVRVERDAILALRTDNRHPEPTGLRTVKAGKAKGVPEEGDELAFVFSEPLDAATVLDGWDGADIDVTVRFDFARSAGGSVTVTLRVEDAALGTVTLSETKPGRQDKMSVTFGTTASPSRMANRGRAVVVTLGAPSAEWPDDSLGVTWRWEPDASVRDVAGFELTDQVVVREPSAETLPLF